MIVISWTNECSYFLIYRLSVVRFILVELLFQFSKEKVIFVMFSQTQKE